MRVLLTGVTGLIGAAICARLAGDGHEIVGVSRHPPIATLGHMRHVRLDLARATTPADFVPLLEDVDAVVNCAGTLQDAPGELAAGVHHRGLAALLAACLNQGVRKLIHSAQDGTSVLA